MNQVHNDSKLPTSFSAKLKTDVYVQILSLIYLMQSLLSFKMHEQSSECPDWSVYTYTHIDLAREM